MFIVVTKVVSIYTVFNFTSVDLLTLGQLLTNTTGLFELPSTYIIGSTPLIPQ